ncbi:hypothetical protein C8F01DRAFT_1122752 [Mycena amicta]|nr:hypothetical protein C8F01DRAFT_1122752 [Mycena amicta]
MPVASSSSRSFLFSEEFDSCWKWIEFLVAKKIAEALFYALSMALLSFAIFTLHRRDAKVANTRFWLSCSYIMVLMGTMQIILNFFDLALSLSILQQMDIISDDTCTSSTAPWDTHGNATSQDVGIVAWLLLTTNVTFADAIFIYRCYLLWGHKWKVIIAPCILLVSTAVTGVIVSLQMPGIAVSLQMPGIDNRIPFILGVSTNVILIGLSVGRIISIRRNVVSLSLDVLQSRYSTALAVIIESGALYCVSAILVVIGQSINQGNTIVYYAATGAACHITNIVPTLAIVRTGLGYNMDHLKANKEPLLRG